MEKETFYNMCADLLAVDQKFVNIPQYGRTGRWGPRRPGNGRFAGFGVIRWYSKILIHVMTADGTQTFTSPEAVFEYIKNIAPSTV